VSVLQLRYVTGPRRDQTLIFSGRRVRLGRSRDNDVTLPEEPAPNASAHHAEVRREGAEWWIVDLESLNGTRLNGAAVDRAELHTGDVIAIGDLELAVEIGERSRRWLTATTAIAILAIAALAFVLVRQVRRTSFEAVAAAAPQSVYLLAVDDRGQRTVTGTAFAVDGAGALLATNAHVVDALKRRSEQGLQPVAIMSDHAAAIPLRRTWVHPEWRKGSVEHDVALVELAGHPALTPLRLGDGRAVERLHRGAPLATFGFPAVSTDPQRPRGRLAVDVVGDVRLPYIEVGLLIAPGTSGSPVFDQAGTVVGMVVGGDFVTVNDGRGRRPSGSGVNWVIAVTVLRELLDGIK
jgi:S1-C subfamily serine protease